MCYEENKNSIGFRRMRIPMKSEKQIDTDVTKAHLVIYNTWNSLMN